MENLRKKNQTEIQEIKSPFSQIKMTVEGQSSRLEQVEDRISELKDKIHIKEKNRKNSRAVNRICKNSVTPSKCQNLELWALKNDKGYNPKRYIIYSTK
jgi:hypothetical protein